MDEDVSTDQAERLAVSVDAALAGERLDRAIAATLPHISRSQVKKLIEDGAVTDLATGQAETRLSRKVRAGDLFELIIACPPDAAPLAEDIPLDIVYEDPHLLVINKPAGMVVHPAAGNWSGTLVNALLHHCGPELTQAGSTGRPGIVHRLDKDTTGLMVVAKTQATHRALARLIESRRMRRIYRGFAWGLPRATRNAAIVQDEAGIPWIRIETQLARSAANRQKVAVVAGGGRVAITNVRVLARFGGARMPIASEIECRLETGRTHQIRVHMTHLGHALIGDPVYGGAHKAVRKTLAPDVAQALATFPRQALHASDLAFPHPVSGEHLVFHAELPNDMAHLKAKLESLQ